MQTIKKTIAFSIILFVLACSKKETTTCNASFVGVYEGTQKIFIGNVDLSKGNIIPPINDALMVNTLDNELSAQSTLMDYTMLGNTSNIQNNTLVMDSIILFLNESEAIEINTDLAPGGTLKLWQIRASAKLTLNCDELNSEIIIKSARTNFTNPLDTFNNLINLAGKNVALRGTFTRK